MTKAIPDWLCVKNTNPKNAAGTEDNAASTKKNQFICFFAGAGGT